MISEFKTGPQILGDGTQITARAGRTGEVSVADAHARYQEAVMRGSVYCAANTAAQALSLGSATATGLILSNPAGSSKNLVILEITSYIAAAVTAVANVALFVNKNAAAATTVHTTVITPTNALIGGSTGVGLVDSAATLPAVPSLVRSIFGWSWAATSTSAFQLGVKDEVAGAIILLPGTTLSIQGVTVAHSVISSITWEEVVS